MPNRRMNWIGSLVLAAVFLTGCADIKSIGGGPIPVYHLPDKLAFTPEEATTLGTWVYTHPELFRKIQDQEHAYRAILQSHNKWAKETNRKRLEAMGFKDSDLREVLNEGR